MGYKIWRFLDIGQYRSRHPSSVTLRVPPSPKVRGKAYIDSANINYSNIPQIIIKSR